uniref:Non-haem dioxygenase N-terminal domain-containing protein n=3 Tax=Ditylum brightwellii TaxID=49249 RepID=A0A6U3SML8_9STRA|mmetsp:Transcript_34178/g.51033  ORF Transcript_34178/g.51033 Transcript_34178/m.51033 type:complete len:404 (-) Transcript_34178:51-1262(-)
MSKETNNKGEVVTMSYTELMEATSKNSVNNKGNNSVVTLEKIGKAFGEDSSLGILCVSDVPNFVSLRQRLLPLSRQLASLPPEELESVTDEESGYQVGWSHGREKVEGGKFDVGKGSFYANPLTDDLLSAIQQRRALHGTEEDVCTEELERVAKENPAFFAPNVWPTQSIPQLESAVKDMGMLVHTVGCSLAKLCDEYVFSQCPTYNPTQIHTVLQHSLCCKARLLHYFPTTQQPPSKGGDDDFSDWCGWHNDHGSLTGLIPAMYLNAQNQEIPSPDPKAGLYIKSRNGKLTHVSIPSNCLAFQIGETSQVHSGGILQATPHAVRGCRSHGGVEGDVTRESFAVFMEPEYHGDMNIPEGKTVQDTQRKDAEQFLPPSVRTLRSRWKYGMNFGEFSDATFAAFY